MVTAKRGLSVRHQCWTSSGLARKTSALPMSNHQESGQGAPTMTLPGARLYLIDDNGKIASERVIFYSAEARAR